MAAPAIGNGDGAIRSARRSADVVPTDVVVGGDGPAAAAISSSGFYGSFFFGYRTVLRSSFRA